MKKIVTCLVDSIDYVNKNCYQHQLSSVLEKEFDVRYVDLSDLEVFKASNDSIILSRLKLRTLTSKANQLANAISNCKNIFIYEQDPWENFIICSKCNGTYKKVTSLLPHAVFLNTSLWWSDLVKMKGQ